MKKVSVIILFFTVFFLFTACTSKKSSTQQVVMSNIDTVTVSPSPTPSSEPAETSTPAAATKKPAATSPSQPSQTPVKANIAETAPKTAVPETPAPAVKADAPLVFIDAGHGGNDPGASGNGLIEKNVTLDIAKRLNEVLTKNTVKTYMVRTGDTFMDHRDRIYLANDMKASLYISIHCDWYENPKYGGTQTFYTTAKELKLGELTELQYAKLIHNEIINTIKSNNRGITDRPTLAAVKYATMPSILIETGFLSNPTEAANLGTPEYRQKIADAMASGIIQSLKKANLQ